MQKKDFEKTLFEVAKRSNSNAVIVLGSQALFAVTPSLPKVAHLSNEVDIFLKDEEKQLEVDLHVGADSEFSMKHGFYAHALEKGMEWPFPDGCWNRVIPKTISQKNETVTVLFMSPEDLCASKLAVGRDKDIEFVADALARKFVYAGSISEMIALIPEERIQKDPVHGLAKAMAMADSGDEEEEEHIKI